MTDINNNKQLQKILDDYRWKTQQSTVDLLSNMFQSQPIDKNDKKLEQQQQIMDIKQLQQLVIDKPSFINDIISDITLLEESIQLINAKPYKNEQDNILLRDYISKLDKAKNLYVNSVMLNPKLYDIPEINHSLSTIDNT